MKRYKLVKYVTSVYVIWTLLFFAIQYFLLVGNVSESFFTEEKYSNLKDIYSIFAYLANLPSFKTMDFLFGKTSNYLYCDGTGGPGTVCTITNSFYAFLFLIIGLLFYFALTYLICVLFDKIKKSKYATKKQ